MLLWTHLPLSQACTNCGIEDPTDSQLSALQIEDLTAVVRSGAPCALHKDFLAINIKILQHFPYIQIVQLPDSCCQCRVAKEWPQTGEIIEVHICDGCKESPKDFLSLHCGIGAQKVIHRLRLQSLQVEAIPRADGDSRKGHIENRLHCIVDGCVGAWIVIQCGQIQIDNCGTADGANQDE